MVYKKYLFSLALILSSIGVLSSVYADSFSDTKDTITQAMTSLITQYESKIQSLKQENKILRDELAKYQVSGEIKTVSTVPTSPTPAAPSQTPYTGTYANIVGKFNTSLSEILVDNNLPGYGVIGLFEFIAPNSVFISIDDGNNPDSVTAFKMKIAYTYDQNLNFSRVGLFDLDYNTQRYTTISGSNPYIQSIRTRVVNPNYKGKLLDPQTTTSSTTSGSSSVTPVGVADVTFAQIKAAYDKNKLLDALKLSESFIAKNPNDLDTLKIRYRSFYIIGKYEDSLAAVKQIETTTGAAFDRTIACDAAVIAKIAKKTDVSTYYSAICKKK